MKRYEDPNDPLNGKEFHTGKLCIEGCGRLAGTHWSLHWCQPCNAKRINTISTSLKQAITDFKRKQNNEK